MTLATRLSRLTIARMWSMPCIRATAISVSSSMEGEEVRKGCGDADRLAADEQRNGLRDLGHCESAATAWRLASSEEAAKAG
jgi:hypothetical protein